MDKILVFAGTTEGRRLVEQLLSADTGGKTLEVVACVATEYGRDVLENSPIVAGSSGNVSLTILSGRMSEEEMVGLMEREGFQAAADATHPYAEAATACIRRACRRTKTPYLRLLREGGKERKREEDAVYVENTAEAVQYLNETEGKILLTTGSKELEAYTGVSGYDTRLYARVLPMGDVVKRCEELGFSGRQLICMQGPFSYEMNAALLKQTGARYLVTKETGKAGGFDEKIRAARDLGVKAVIIGRKFEGEEEAPEQTYQRIQELLGVSFSGEITRKEKERADFRQQQGDIRRASFQQEPTDTAVSPVERYDWFPLFTNIKDRRIVVIGAGTIANRRIQSLLSFSCKVTVIAPEAVEQVRTAAELGALTWFQKEYETEDLFDPKKGSLADYVLAATSRRSCNHRIFCDCRERGIPVNVADCKEECDFYFPGIARKGSVVAGVTAGGGDHGLAKKAVERIRIALNEMERDEDVNENEDRSYR